MWLLKTRLKVWITLHFYPWPTTFTHNHSIIIPNPVAKNKPAAVENRSGQ